MIVSDANCGPGPLGIEAFRVRNLGTIYIA